MENDTISLEQQIKEQGVLLQNVYRSVEKTRKYFLWTLILTIVFFLLPLIGLIVVIPMALNSYVGEINTLLQ